MSVLGLGVCHGAWHRDRGPVRARCGDVWFHWWYQHFRESRYLHLIRGRTGVYLFRDNVNRGGGLVGLDRKWNYEAYLEGGCED